MGPILASQVFSEPSAAQVGLWILCLYGVMQIADLAMKFANHFREKPAPAATYLTKSEFQAHRDEIKDQLDAMSALDEQRTKELHVRINPLEGQIKAVDEKTEMMSVRLAQIDAKIDRLIERQ